MKNSPCQKIKVKLCRVVDPYILLHDKYKVISSLSAHVLFGFLLLRYLCIVLPILFTSLKACLNFFANLGCIGHSAMPIITLKSHFKYSRLARVNMTYACELSISIMHNVLNIICCSLESLQTVCQPLSILPHYVHDECWNLWILALLISIVQHCCLHCLSPHSHNHYPIPPLQHPYPILDLHLSHHDPTQLTSSCHLNLVCDNCCSTLHEVSLFIGLGEVALESGKGCLAMETECCEYQECGRKGCSGSGAGRWRS